MCGIAGLVAGAMDAELDVRRAVASMCDVLRHRGPDDGGLFVSADSSVALGNRRLAIRDLSAAGHMPMANADDTVWITYNGEIYNASELKAELVSLGFSFRSQSDTEVVLRGYEAWGRDVIDRLRGMFAFGIYDARHRNRPTLLLARDPLGIKPLYYAVRREGLAFASECRPLLASGLAGSTIDPTALLAYLRLGSVPAPLTIYRDVRALEPGSALEVSRDGSAWHTATPSIGWRVPEPAREEARRQCSPEVIEAVRELLLDSVRRHLVSDVPIGAFLSGGLDSGTIVALMREAHPGGVIRTCSVIFDEPRYSEAAYAHAVAKRFDTEHIEVRVTAEDLGRELEHVVGALDQPSNDGLNTYFVSAAARSASLTVALSGLGGDELFGGYPTFRRLGTVLRLSRWADIVPGSRRILTAGLGVRGEHHPAARLGSWMRYTGAAASYLSLRGLFSDRQLRKLVTPEVLSAAGDDADLIHLLEDGAGTVASADGWDAASRYELSSYMRHQLLRDTDAMSMAHSLEVRVPMVDRHVVEQVLTLGVRNPPGALPKYVLREVASALPAQVRNRRDKQGFSFPLQPWLSGPLRPKLEELMRSAEAQLAGYLVPGSADYLLRAFDAGQLHWSRPWALAALCSIFPNAQVVQSRVRPAAVMAKFDDVRDLIGS